MRLRDRPSTAVAILLSLTLVASACASESGASGEADGAPEAASSEAEPEPNGNRVIALLEAGHPVFGIFSGDHTPEQGAAMAGNTETDFVFYSLESGPFDIPAMEAYMAAMAEASGERGPHPVLLRIPPIREDRAAAPERAALGLAAGVAGLVFPHVESAEDAEVARATGGDRLWPLHTEGDVLNVLLIEDRVGIERAREIVGAPGVGVAIPGPGDLRRAFEGDMEAVEAAIQTVLAACLELDVPCGITAGVDDIAARLDQGFRLIIVTQPEALAAGRAASGRSG